MIHADPNPTTDTHSMSCMEIWGGNAPVVKQVTVPGLEAWMSSRPYQQASGGGDVYYVSNCATGRITRLLLADVSGHGQRVSGMAERLRDLMRRYVNHIQQVRFVEALNREFSALQREGGFATAAVATFLASTQNLSFCNAGHPTPFLYRSQTGEWSLLESAQSETGPTNLPLGILADGDYSGIDLTLIPGDMVLFYTDALSEAVDTKGGMLGSEGFLKLVRALEPQPTTLIDHILTAVKSLSAENLLDDDVSLLLFRATGQGRKVPFGRRLVAPFRLFAGIAVALLRGGKGIPLPEISKQNLMGK